MSEPVIIQNLMKKSLFAIILLFFFLIQAHVEFEKKQQTTTEILLNESLCWSLIHQIVKRANSKF